ncbi:MAG: hypothetical protein E6Q77_00360 [Rhizobium sp.]|nr:MAG: hypothetical protein E6Q77_00360 [Rhizobium sp.]
MIAGRSWITGSAIAVSLLATSVPSNAEDGKDCAAISDDAKRLLCYDLIFKIKRTATQQSKWIVQEETSKIDDRKNVFVALDSNERLAGRFGQKDKARLLFACREGKTAFYITFGGHFMSSLNGGTVTYRIDKRPAAKKGMRESTDHQALGLWTAGEAIPFARDLFGAQSLYLQAVPHSESSVSADFDVAGLEQAIKPLAEACKWPAGGGADKQSRSTK